MLKRSLVSFVVVCAVSIPVTATAGREKAELPEFASKHLMSTMRSHLGALEEITRLLSEHQFEKAAAIAEQRLGMSSVEMHYEKFVGKYMPKSMRVMGKKMHEAATQFSVTARSAKEDDLEKVLAGLADVMEQCGSCHSSYRVKSKE